MAGGHGADARRRRADEAPSASAWPCAVREGLAPVGGQGAWDRCDYFRGRTASLSCLAMCAWTSVLAGIWIGSPVAGFRPSLALRFWTTSLHMPGSTNSP